MKLTDIQRNYRLGFIHNPNEFQTNSFAIETQGKRLILVGVVKRNRRKRYRIVAVLKPR